MQKVEAEFRRVRGKKLLVALSGGADSVALLSLLRAWGGCEIAAAHFDHMIRGAESARDADFCRGLCAEWNIDYFFERADVPAEAGRRGEGIETVAREMRYDFLRRAKHSAQADYVVLAHHMDDQAETVLMHLLRGAGVAGIAGMRTLSGDLFRPLLNVRKRELVEYLAGKSIPWREDATNSDACTPRNALRLKGIPALERAYPAAVSAIARHASLSLTEDDCMQTLAAGWLEKNLERGAFGLFLRLDDLPHEAIFRRAVRTAVSHLARELPDHAKTDELWRIARSERGATQLSGDLRAEKTPSGLYILPGYEAPEPVRLNPEGETVLPEICRILAEPWQGECIRRNGPVQTLSRRALEGAMLRTRRDGDRIRPFGMQGEKLLSDYLTDRKIDRPRRDVLPLIACGERVLWVCGVGISQDAALREGDDGIRLTLLPDTADNNL